MNRASQSKLWRCRDDIFDLSHRTLIMGILNVTPDSFSDGGDFVTVDRAVRRALQMQEQGADIIDVGGESTRPGALPVSEQEEVDRIAPVIERLKGELNIPVSIDTYKSKAAKAALQAGACIINDISGCRFDADMPRVAASHRAGLILMHIKGEPRNMQVNPHYDNLMQEITAYLEQSITIATTNGVDPSQIVIDPGIGFGKRLQDNFQILNQLRTFEQLRRPILVGPSRKSFIGALLDAPPKERLEGTIAAVTAAIMNGADIVRVHDVDKIKRAAVIADTIIGKSRLPKR